MGEEEMNKQVTNAEKESRHGFSSYFIRSHNETLTAKDFVYWWIFYLVYLSFRGGDYNLLATARLLFKKQKRIIKWPRKDKLTKRFQPKVWQVLSFS